MLWDVLVATSINKPFSFYIDMCTDIFGAEFNRSTIDAAIANTLENYGGTSNYMGTKVILPNGSVDPWHALGLANSTSSSVIPIFIHDTARKLFISSTL